MLSFMELWLDVMDVVCEHDGTGVGGDSADDGCLCCFFHFKTLLLVLKRPLRELVEILLPILFNKKERAIQPCGFYICVCKNVPRGLRMCCLSLFVLIRVMNRGENEAKTEREGVYEKEKAERGSENGRRLLTDESFRAAQHIR